MMTLFAQASPDVAKSAIDRLPDILKSVAGNPFGFSALILMVLAGLAWRLFGKANGKVKLIAFGMVAFCVLFFCGFVVFKFNESAPPKSDPVSLTQCKVIGHVYNDDVTPATGLQNVKLSYVASNVTNAQPVQVSTTAPDGFFRFDCSQVKPESFPIHLRATYQNQAIESEDTLLFGENTDVNLYISPRAISNHYRVSTLLLKISSQQLLKANFTTMTNTLVPVSAKPNKVIAVPNNVKFERSPLGAIHLDR